ncbi:hypothetical protein GCM10007391_02950 [Alteromonas halophila]|uniref:Uncharacterized protein n=1 Tax=Alteromonas halophila TaxID=516698 RepID=A0A918JE02_9ALTE|nr:hypothetical protein GCM10007391_02950 [Alteromonas halophila]
MYALFIPVPETLPPPCKEIRLNKHQYDKENFADNRGEAGSAAKVDNPASGGCPHMKIVLAFLLQTGTFSV